MTSNQPIRRWMSLDFNPPLAQISQITQQPVGVAGLTTSSFSGFFLPSVCLQHLPKYFTLKAANPEKQKPNDFHIKSPTFRGKASCIDYLSVGTIRPVMLPPALVFPVPVNGFDGISSELTCSTFCSSKRKRFSASSWFSEHTCALWM